MNRVLAVMLLVLALVVCGVAAILVLEDRKLAPDRVAIASDPDAKVDRLSQEVALLTDRVARLERSSELAPPPARTPTPAPGAVAPAIPASADEMDAQAFLDRYVLSFAEDEKGSELYRLMVDAHVAELVAPICGLVLESGRPLALRVSLVSMLGRSRFRGDARVADALLAVLGADAPERLGSAAVDAILAAGAPAILPGLEGKVLAIASPRVRSHALQVAARIAGEGANAMLLRLLVRAPDDAIACEIFALLDSVDRESALLAFRHAAGRNQPVRLCGARKIGEFSAQPFADFVAEWLGFETDAQVIAALKAALQQQHSVPAWNARQAIGPPDAQRDRDDPKAWASAEPDMGMQWLELDYATPMAANAVRIHEVNVPGAVAEVAARGPSGGWVTLWSGIGKARGGEPLQVEFPTTAFAVRTLRVILDTNRAPGWNEIDAVELLGPGGRAWASDARASSNFGSGGLRTAAEPRPPR